MIRLAALVLLLNGCGGIQILTPHSATDESARYQATLPAYAGADSLWIREARAGTLDSLRRAPGRTWLVVWAPWCASCVANLPKYRAQAARRGYRLVMASTSYKLPAVQKLLRGNQYTGVTYVLSSADYGTLENEKVVRLRRQLCPDCPGPAATGVPQQYLLAEGRTVAYHYGSNLDSLFAQVAQQPK